MQNCVKYWILEGISCIYTQVRYHTGKVDFMIKTVFGAGHVCSNTIAKKKKRKKIKDVSVSEEAAGGLPKGSLRSDH